MNVAAKRDVWHLIRRGVVMQLHFDLERAWLTAGPGPITDYGAAVGDIAGNLVHSEDVRLRLPERYLPDPNALLATATMPGTLTSPDRDVYPIGIGKIAWGFERAAEKIDLLPLTQKTVRIEITGRKRAGTRKISEQINEYPLIGDDGSIVYDVRYHPKRTQLSYRSSADALQLSDGPASSSYYSDGATGETWILVEPRLLVSGYRIWPEIDWLRSAFVEAGFHPNDVFFAKEDRYYTVDCSMAAQHVSIFGPQGKGQLHLGTRRMTGSAESWDSLDLRDVMAANSPGSAEDESGPTLLMPDGRIYEQTGRHPLTYDAQASFALYNYMRRLAPQILENLERQANRSELEEMLAGARRPNPSRLTATRTPFRVEREWLAAAVIPAGTFVAHSYGDHEAVTILCELFPQNFLTVLPPITVGPHEFVSSHLIDAVRAAPALVHVVSANSRESEWVALERAIAGRAGKPIYRFDPDRRQFEADRSRRVRPVIHAVTPDEDRELVRELVEWLAKERNFELEMFDPRTRLKAKDLYHHVRDFGGEIVVFADQDSIGSLPMAFIHLCCEPDPYEKTGPRRNVFLATLGPPGNWTSKHLRSYLCDEIDLTDGGRTQPWSANRLDDLMVRILWRQTAP